MTKNKLDQLCGEVVCLLLKIRESPAEVVKMDDILQYARGQEYNKLAYVDSFQLKSGRL